MFVKTGPGLYWDLAIVQVWPTTSNQGSEHSCRDQLLCRWFHMPLVIFVMLSRKLRSYNYLSKFFIYNVMNYNDCADRKRCICRRNAVFNAGINLTYTESTLHTILLLVCPVRFHLFDAKYWIKDEALWSDLKFFLSYDCCDRAIFFLNYVCRALHISLLGQLLQI